MCELIGILSFLGWIMGGIGIIALLADRDARLERESKLANENQKPKGAV